MKAIKPTYHCEDCNEVITKGEYIYSMNVFNRALCMRRCQEQARKDTYGIGSYAKYIYR